MGDVPEREWTATFCVADMLAGVQWAMCRQEGNERVYGELEALDVGLMELWWVERCPLREGAAGRTLVISVSRWELSPASSSFATSPTTTVRLLSTRAHRV